MFNWYHSNLNSKESKIVNAMFPNPIDPLSRLIVSTREPRLEALVRFFHARMRTRSRG